MEKIQSRSAFPFLSNVFGARDLPDHDSYMIRPSVYKRVINYLSARLFNFLVLLVLEKRGFSSERSSWKRVKTPLIVSLWVGLVISARWIVGFTFHTVTTTQPSALTRAKLIYKHIVFLHQLPSLKIRLRYRFSSLLKSNVRDTN